MFMIRRQLGTLLTRAPGLNAYHPERSFSVVTRRLNENNTQSKTNNRGRSINAQIEKPDSVAKIATNWKASAVKDGEVVRLSLEEFLGSFVVLLFYPFDFTYVCPTELLAFSDRIEEFNSRDAKVIGVSCDSEFSHLAWSKVPRNQGGIHGIKIPLVSDYKKTISKRYSVLNELNGAPFRGLIILDKEHRIRVIHINDSPIGRSVDETLRLLDAIKHVNEFGEVCPVNWKKGDPTIVPTPKGAEEYFSKISPKK